MLFFVNCAATTEILRMEGDLKDQANQLFDAGDYKRSVRLFSQLANVVPNADERAAALIGRRKAS